MSVIEKLSVISDTITKVMNFVLTSDIIKPDFDEYIAALSAKNADTSIWRFLVQRFQYYRR